MWDPWGSRERIRQDIPNTRKQILSLMFLVCMFRMWNNKTNPPRQRPKNGSLCFYSCRVCFANLLFWIYESIPNILSNSSIKSIRGYAGRLTGFTLTLCLKCRCILLLMSIWTVCHSCFSLGLFNCAVCTHLPPLSGKLLRATPYKNTGRRFPYHISITNTQIQSFSLAPSYYRTMDAEEAFPSFDL